jgi:hypothetical protein
MSKIALSMITKGTEKVTDLQRCLNSIKPYVDGIYITITTPPPDNKLEVALKRYGAVVDSEFNNFSQAVDKKTVDWLEKFLGEKPFLQAGDKIFDFSKARNHNLQRVPKSFGWILWMDADDIFRGGQNLKELIQTAETNQADSVFLNYIYQAEIENNKLKNILIEHLRERIVRNNGTYEWVAPIHETLIEKRPTKKIDYVKCDVLHLAELSRREQALGRNTKTLELSIYNGKGADPRPVYYLGKSYFDHFLQLQDKKYLIKAKKLFEYYIFGTKEYDNNNKSGWAEERAQCWEYLVEIYRQIGEYNNAIKCAHNAMIEDERFPSIYLNLALIYLVKGEYGRALWWVKLAGKMEQPSTTLVSTPKDLAGRALEVIYHACLNLSKLDEAWAAAVKLQAIYPDSKEMKERLQFMEGLKTQRKLSRNVMELADYLLRTNEKEKIKLLVNAAPNLIANNPLVADLKKQFIPSKAWKDDEVVFYCGPGWTCWSPKSLGRTNDTEFVGGSEEAVIYLTKELQKLGWKVTVFADPGAETGLHDGVNWLPYYEFNDKDEFNIVISWRQLGLVDKNIKAKKIYIWCHDVINQLDYTPDRLGKIEKVIVLSEAHRQTAPNIPDNKMFVSSNGINLQEENEE